MIAFYMRLSVADGDVRNDEREESNSIENQRAVLSDFVEHRKDLSGDVIEYIDDGYSGTNFDRPAFKEMIEDMKAGKIKVLLTKDLSRLGRNFIEVGDYMEQIFPLLGVRYIAINSNYDSNNFIGSTIGLEMSVMNLVNNLYCKDLSKKVRSGVETKWKSGKSTSGRPPFGYLIDPDNKGGWIIDPPAAVIVRHIFEMAANGDSYSHIVNTLNTEHIPTPGQYREKYGHVKRVNRKVKDSEWLWEYENIWRMLKTMEYTGVLVQKKTSRIKVGSTAARRIPDEERIFIENHHEPIVDEETYYKARALIREHKKGGVVNIDDYPLRKLIYCGNCGLMMHKPRALDRYVVCRHKEVAGMHSKCNDDRYPLETIDYNVRCALRDQLLKLKELRDEKEQGKLNLPDFKRKVDKMNMEIKGLKVDKTRLYESYAAGHISRENYIAKRTSVKEKLESLEASIAEIKAPDEEASREIHEADQYLRLADKMYDPHNLTEEVAEAFIEKILIYDAEHMEIVFKFQDLMQQMLAESMDTDDIMKAGETA